MRPASPAPEASAIQGMGGGANVTAGAKLCLNAYTQAYVKSNHTSASDDDLFEDFTICS
jgi:hypothetical protein